VKFLAVATSTGFLIPGLTCHLVEAMRLSPHIQRADVVGMGCHAGLNVLQVASNWALANPGANAVMCCIEICSGRQPRPPVSPPLFASPVASAVTCCCARVCWVSRFAS
jgi:predicted naringenin-chalcone synthase